MIYFTRWLKAGSLPTKKFDFIYFEESPLKMMKNVFYFMLKSSFRCWGIYIFFPGFLVVQRNGLIRMLWLSWLLGFRKLGLWKRLKFCNLFLFCELHHEKKLFFMDERNAVFFLIFTMKLFSATLSYLKAHSTLNAHS